jgi:hypothetical protein
VTGLEELAFVAAQLAAAERLTDAIRDRRDRLVLTQAEAGTPHAVIGAAAELSVKGVGKITRAAGLSRYSARLEPGAPKSTEGESGSSAS